MRKLQAAEKYIALKRIWRIANKIEANITSHNSIALKVFFHVVKLRYFLELVNLPLCFRFGEQRPSTRCLVVSKQYVEMHPIC